MLTKNPRKLRKEIIFCVIMFSVYFNIWYPYNYPDLTFTRYEVISEVFHHRCKSVMGYLALKIRSGVHLGSQVYKWL